MPQKQVDKKKTVWQLVLERMALQTPYNIKTLAEDLNIPYQSVWLAMARLEKRGRIRKLKANSGLRVRIS